jgi:hypothetical protein
MEKYLGSYASCAMFVLSAFVGLLALAPTASAHDCTAENPSTSCGECLSGDHYHRYNNGNRYCSSTDSGSGGGCKSSMACLKDPIPDSIDLDLDGGADLTFDESLVNDLPFKTAAT